MTEQSPIERAMMTARLHCAEAEVSRLMIQVDELLDELSKAEAKAQDQFQDGVKTGLEQAAELLTVSRSAILLAAGEMTAQEMRSVKAVFAWRQRVIRSASTKSVIRR